MFVEIKPGRFVSTESKDGKVFVKAREAEVAKVTKEKAAEASKKAAELKAERVAELQELLKEAKK